MDLGELSKKVVRNFLQLIKRYGNNIKEVINMQFSKELEENIDRELAEYEQEKREGKIKFYSEKEAMKLLFEGRYAGLNLRDFADRKIYY